MRGNQIFSSTGVHCTPYWHALGFRVLSERNESRRILHVHMQDAHPSGSPCLSTVCYGFGYWSLGRKWFKVLSELGNWKIAPSNTCKGLKWHFVGKQTNAAKHLPWLVTYLNKFQAFYCNFGNSRLSVNISSLLKILMVLDEHKSVRKPQIYSFFKFFTYTEIVPYHFSDLFILLFHKKYYTLLNC